MLIRFGTSNFYSIRDYAELSLVASPGIKDAPEVLISPRGIKEKLLPAALVYGANAAGKTTIYTALRVMRSHVLNSFNRPPNMPVTANTFALDPTCADKASRFDADFIIGETRYHYGFEIKQGVYSSEWLYSFPEGHRRLLFNREDDKFTFGKTLKGQNRVISGLTRKNALFLTAATQNAHPQLSEVHSYFENKIATLGSSINFRTIQQESDHLEDRIIRFLNVADTGVVAARTETVAPDEKQMAMFESMVKAVRPFIEDVESVDTSFSPPDTKKILLGHTSTGPEPVYLEFKSESRGTARLVQMLRRVFGSLDQGSTLLIDELDVSLHTLLSGEIVKLFLSSATNPHGAQLIATTHDTNLLCFTGIRRDQIWFAEKDDAGSTFIYPLTDIKTRNTDNLEKGYLQGRFGAIPFFGSRDALFASATDGENG